MTSHDRDDFLGGISLELLEEQSFVPQNTNTHSELCSVGSKFRGNKKVIGKQRIRGSRLGRT